MLYSRGLPFRASDAPFRGCPLWFPLRRVRGTRLYPKVANKAALPETASWALTGVPSGKNRFAVTFFYYAELSWTALPGFGRALSGLPSLVPTPPCPGNTVLSENYAGFPAFPGKTAFPETASWALTGVPSGKNRLAVMLR